MQHARAGVRELALCSVHRVDRLIEAEVRHLLRQERGWSTAVADGLLQSQIDDLWHVLTYNVSGLHSSDATLNLSEPQRAAAEACLPVRCEEGEGTHGGGGGGGGAPRVLIRTDRRQIVPIEQWPALACNIFWQAASKGWNHAVWLASLHFYISEPPRGEHATVPAFAVPRAWLDNVYNVLLHVTGRCMPLGHGLDPVDTPTARQMIAIPRSWLHVFLSYMAEVGHAYVRRQKRKCVGTERVAHHAGDVPIIASYFVCVCHEWGRVRSDRRGGRARAAGILAPHRASLSHPSARTRGGATTSDEEGATDVDEARDADDDSCAQRVMHDGAVSDSSPDSDDEEAAPSASQAPTHSSDDAGRTSSGNARSRPKRCGYSMSVFEVDAAQYDCAFIKFLRTEHTHAPEVVPAELPPAVQRVLRSRMASTTSPDAESEAATVLHELHHVVSLGFGSLVQPRAALAHERPADRAWSSARVGAASNEAQQQRVADAWVDESPNPRSLWRPGRLFMEADPACLCEPTLVALREALEPARTHYNFGGADTFGAAPGGSGSGAQASSRSTRAAPDDASGTAIDSQPPSIASETARRYPRIQWALEPSHLRGRASSGTPPSGSGSGSNQVEGGGGFAREPMDAAVDMPAHGALAEGEEMAGTGAAPSLLEEDARGSVSLLHQPSALPTVVIHSQDGGGMLRSSGGGGDVGGSHAGGSRTTTDLACEGTAAAAAPPPAKRARRHRG